jgi:hypothetical protein
MIYFFKNIKNHCYNYMYNNKFTYSEKKKLYYLLYHKISNFQKLTDIEIYSIEILDYNERLLIIQLLNNCIKVLISYMEL